MVGRGICHEPESTEFRYFLQAGGAFFRRGRLVGRDRQRLRDADTDVAISRSRCGHSLGRDCLALGWLGGDHQVNQPTQLFTDRGPVSDAVHLERLRLVDGDRRLQHHVLGLLNRV